MLAVDEHRDHVLSAGEAAGDAAAARGGDGALVGAGQPAARRPGAAQLPVETRRGKVAVESPAAQGARPDGQAAVWPRRRQRDGRRAAVGAILQHAHARRAAAVAQEEARRRRAAVCRARHVDAQPGRVVQAGAAARGLCGATHRPGTRRPPPPPPPTATAEMAAAAATPPPAAAAAAARSARRLPPLASSRSASTCPRLCCTCRASRAACCRSTT